MESVPQPPLDPPDDDDGRPSRAELEADKWARRYERLASGEFEGVPWSELPAWVQMLEVMLHEGTRDAD